ncbi:sulfurtransferase complex subunit TusC [Vreelandella populi]|uniref:Sulfurtransferase complex subunit TusC n=1 Tax=Vreelandella populi TaxID=2498858 RepID=A0A3S0YA73_9GAMM|nr:sulfurtransferase complex subunit TusC [Halomonas populi]RUR38479.1 sulfurtransferase complex subunit TusC [Halomonas populi]RUR43481.1 sulfurtransferase complex subunit TusC [Halomonas populi]RUR51630.1 sulfurtransferase complex subunit TusC [Halomonas populi]
MEESNSLLVIIRHAPYSSNLLREGLDAALVAAAFGHPVDLLFLGQGVTALLKKQGSGAPGMKATRPTMDMLEMYDIEQLWTSEETLEALSLTRSKLRDNVQLVQAQKMPAFMKNYSQILNF